MTEVALVHRDGETTYAELDALTRRAADQMDALGLPGGTPIAIRAVKSPETIALVRAARRPVLLVSVDLGAEVAATLVERAGCAGVVTPGSSEWTPAAVRPDAPRLPAGTRLMLTTSGSTGVPKIVPLGGDGIQRFIGWATDTFGLTAGTRVLSYAPLNFDLSLLDVWATLHNGGTTVLVDPDRAVNSSYLKELMRTARPHVVQAVPMFYRLLACEQAFPEVRHVVLTGDHTPRPLRASLPALFPDATFHNVYGCTETNDSYIHTFGADEAATADVLPLGEPLPGVESYVAGDGELVVSTPFQAAGYVDGATFPERDGRIWYHTGDLVNRDDAGRLILAGRTDFQVKVRGVRVSLEEIEQVLLAHPDVAEAAVVALPDPAAGNRISAVVRPRSSGLTGLKVRSWCAARLTRTAIPSVFDLRTDALPIGVTGKVDRNRLRAELTAELEKEPA
jgi:acyl-coenzyme A synthetase/AMP-(fatty) acid ligase